MTLTQMIEAAMDNRGWTPAEKVDWCADAIYDGMDAEIKPAPRSCPAAARRKAITFRLLSVISEGTILRDDDGTEATLRGGYVYIGLGEAIANYGGLLTPSLNGDRLSDSLEVVEGRSKLL